MGIPNTLFRARAPTRRLKIASKILQQLGMKPSDAFNMLLAQIELRKGLPFELNTRPKPLLSSDDQAANWTDAFGPY